MKTSKRQTGSFAGIAAHVCSACLLASSITVLAFEPGPPGSDPNFEIDIPSANALDDSAYAGDDWQTVYRCHPGGPGYDSVACASLGGLNANLINTTGIMLDPAPRSIFRKGGSKDIRDVSDWAWKDGSVPDKDEITHAYAAAYNIDNELIMYIGADRYSNDGDAMMGAWFFQDVVELAETRPGEGVFSGRHKNGDILWIGHFSGGGVIAEMKVLKWNASSLPGFDGDCLDTSALPAQQKGTQLCLIAEGPDELGYFASVNSQWTESPWPYTPKQGEPGYESGWFPVNSFMEGGLNISTLLGGNTPCYSSFLIQSRSSTEFSAQLKDFVLGRIDTCKIDVAKSCESALGADGASIDHRFRITVSNTGYAMLDSIDLVDTQNPASPWTHAAPAPGESLEVADYTVNAAQQELTNEVTAVGTTAGGYATSPATDTVTCAPVPVDPGLMVTKDCDRVQLVPADEKLLVQVSFQGSVCNTGDVRLVDVTATDTREGSVHALQLSASALNPPGTGPEGSDCASFSESYYPSERVASGVTVEWNAECGCFDAKDLQHWGDTVNASGYPVLGSGPVNAIADPADCPLCPACPE